MWKCVSFILGEVGIAPPSEVNELCLSTVAGSILIFILLPFPAFVGEFSFSFSLAEYLPLLGVSLRHTLSVQSLL